MTLSPDSVLPSCACLEACENYQKQSYRNRCYILGPQGPQMLQVPVMHHREEETLPVAFARTGSRNDAEVRVPSAMPICQVQVDYSTPWVVRTERALDTAYETAAYYEYYRDGVFARLEAQHAALWELNRSLAEWCMSQLGVHCRLQATTAFAAPGSVSDDYRYVIHPKHPDTVLQDLGLDRPYYQVFRDRMGGFTPGLSILDLLFNEGPDSILWLKAL